MKTVEIKTPDHSEGFLNTPDMNLKLPPEALFEVRRLSPAYDYLAPDGSEIRLLARMPSGNSCHCKLGPGKTSKAVKHKTVNELWFVLSGKGEMWQRKGLAENVISLEGGTSLTLPVGNSFQFRNTGKADLEILIVTMPEWPGMEEAIPCEGFFEKQV